jgi:hypothetical protein
MSLPAVRSPRVPAPPHRFDPSPDLAEENTMTIMRAVPHATADHGSHPALDRRIKATNAAIR